MRRLSKYVAIAKIHFANTLAYRAGVWSRFAFYTLFIYVFMGLWGAIYREGSVHGYSYTQIVWYLIMSEFVAFVMRGEAYRALGDEVRSGTLAYQLGRPVHYLLYHFAGFAGQALMNGLCFGALAAALGFAFVGPLPTFRMEEIAPVLLSLGLSATLNFFLMMLIGLSAFAI